MRSIRGIIFALSPSVVQELILDVLGKKDYWKTKAFSEVDEATINDFIKVNKKYWLAKKQTKKSGVLVEGHLSQYGPNYLFRTAIAALALSEKHDLDIEVIYNGYRQDWVVANKVYQSFGIYTHRFLGSMFFFRNLYYRIVSRLVASRIRRKLNSPSDILTITFNSIKVGDLIYDDILKNLNLKTILEIDKAATNLIAKSYFYYLQYRRLFSKRNYKYYVSTHTQYSEYGLLCRVALMNNVMLLETTDIQMSFYDEIRNDHLPTYHEGIRKNIIEKLLDNTLDKAVLRHYAKEKLAERFDSKIDQIDIKKAYVGRIYDKIELIEKFKLNNSTKIVFIVAHIFSDSPHLSSSMLHDDYYDWLQKTLEICSEIDEICWLVKPHPASEIYKENGYVEKMVNKLNSKNVFVCPEDLNTKSLKTCSDAIVTVHGTAGLEFSCIGIPVVVAGKPFYSGFGFNIEPKSKQEYVEVLSTLDNRGPLSDDQVNKALEVYAIWEQQFDWYNPIITADVLANVWGSGFNRNVKKAYELITENLKDHDPKALKLWNYAQRIVENSK